jgi:hypothetical protein
LSGYLEGAGHWEKARKNEQGQTGAFLLARKKPDFLFIISD